MSINWPSRLCSTWRSLERCPHVGQGWDWAHVSAKSTPHRIRLLGWKSSQCCLRMRSAVTLSSDKIVRERCWHNQTDCMLTWKLSSCQWFELLRKSQGWNEGALYEKVESSSNSRQQFYSDASEPIPKLQESCAANSLRTLQSVRNRGQEIRCEDLQLGLVWPTDHLIWICNSNCRFGWDSKWD